MDNYLTTNSQQQCSGTVNQNYAKGNCNGTNGINDLNHWNNPSRLNPNTGGAFIGRKLL